MRRPAVFLDRDGVINIDKGYVYKKEDFIWVPGAKEAIKLLNDKGYLVFVVTNQSGVARGYYSEHDVKEFHRHLQENLMSTSAHIDQFYYCPHHPEGRILQYQVTCKCRKPAPGMIFQALSEWHVDAEKSILIGDKDSDIEAGQSANIKSYLFESNRNLYNFVNKIVLHRRD